MTIKLRAGAAWSDGHPFTARDVAYTYNMLIENGNTKKNLRQAVQVAQRVKQAVVVDDLTVMRIELSHPDPRHVFLFVTSYFAYGLFWVPEHIWRDVDDKAAFTYFDLEKGWPLTTAAWKVVGSSPSEVICDPGVTTGRWGVKTGIPPVAGCRSASSPCRTSRASGSRNWRCRTRSTCPATSRTCSCCWRS